MTDKPTRDPREPETTPSPSPQAEAPPPDDPDRSAPPSADPPPPGGPYWSWIPGVAGALCILAFLLYRQALGEVPSWMGAVGGAGVVLVLLWAWLDRLRLESAAESRAVRYGSGALVLALLAAAIGVVVNIIAHRYDKRWDATASKQHTLSSQTVQVIQNLERPVQVAAFFPSESPEESAFRSLADAYEQYDADLEFEFHDPLREPFLAQQFEITNQYGTVVLTSGDATRRLETTFDESALTNALVQVTSGESHTICVTTEHGERDPDDDYDLLGYGLAVQKLEGQNYTVETFSMLQEGGVPDRCEVLMVAAPQVDLLPVEREALAAWIAQGGAAFLLLEPLVATQTAADLSRYGLSLAEDLVLEDNPEARRMGLDASYVVVSPDRLDFHPITEGLQAGVLFQTVRSVSKQQAVAEGLQVQEIARTTASAWAETRLEGQTAAEPDEGDIIGDVPIMATVQVQDPTAIPRKEPDLAGAASPPLPAVQALAAQGDTGTEPGASTPAEGADPTSEDTPADDSTSTEGGRLVVVGDADFASNQLLLQGMNQDLFLNTLAWLVGEEDQIAVRPNEARAGGLELSMAQGVLVWFLALAGIPGLAVVGAISTWSRRRRL